MKKENAGYWFKEGNAKLNSEHYEEAFKCYEKSKGLIQRKDGEEFISLILANMGLTKFYQAKNKKDVSLFEEAEKYYEKANQLNQSDAEICCDLGLAKYYLAKSREQRTESKIVVWGRGVCEPKVRARR